MNADDELTTEQASRQAVTAVTADLEYWASSMAVGGQVGLNDLIRTLDMLREASVPQLPITHRVTSRGA
jgi:hypothetical protein